MRLLLVDLGILSVSIVTFVTMSGFIITSPPLDTSV